MLFLRRVARAAGGCLLPALLLTAPAQAADRYGAIAYSVASGAIGVAADNASQDEAESVALANCRAEAGQADDCKNVMWVRNACAVLAIGDDGGWGTHWGQDKATAERNGLGTCAQYSRTCKVVRRVCTSAE